MGKCNPRSSNGKLKASQRPNLLLARITLGPLCKELHRAWLRLSLESNEYCGADVLSIYLSETQFETFQEPSDFDFCLGSGKPQHSGSKTSEMVTCLVTPAKWEGEKEKP